MALPTPAVRPQLTGALASTATAFAPLPLARTLDAEPEPQFVSAPAFDEDHPDELSYRPFPIAPLMTTTASADDPALAVMTHPNFARTFDLLDQAGSMLPMRLRPTLKVAEMMWTQQFTGAAVNFAALQDEPVGTGLRSRSVRTQ